MIYLSAGHSNKDPGASVLQRIVGAPSILRTEADIVVGFRNIVSFYLTRAGMPHDTDGSGTENLPLSAAIKEIGRNRPALEFHCNASTSPSAGGVETLSTPQDLVFGADLTKAVSTVLGIRDRGAKPEDAGQHHRLAFVQAGGIIVELFFLTNPSDLAAYDAKSWLAGRAVANLLIERAERTK